VKGLGGHLKRDPNFKVAPPGLDSQPAPAHVGSAGVVLRTVVDEVTFPNGAGGPSPYRQVDKGEYGG